MSRTTSDIRAALLAHGIPVHRSRGVYVQSDYADFELEDGVDVSLAQLQIVAEVFGSNDVHVVASGDNVEIIVKHITRSTGE